jgi:glycosyltransferase involved in cell wall biosynthesis
MLIEAMVCGKLVLAFNIPSSKNKIIDNSISELSIKPPAESLSETLRILTGNPKALRAMGLKARNIAEMKNSWQVILPNTL